MTVSVGGGVLPLPDSPKKSIILNIIIYVYRESVWIGLDLFLLLDPKSNSIQ